MAVKESEQKNRNLLGYKFFLYLEESDSFKIIRIVKVYNNGQVMIEDEETKERSKTTPEILAETGYTPLDPPGIIAASVVEIQNRDGSVDKDVILTFTKKIHIIMTNRLPLVVCRQSVTDIFYSMLADDTNHPYVGVSVSQRTCPGNFEFENFLACSEIEYSQVIHTYMDDEPEDILSILNLSKYDQVLADLYERHVKAKGDPSLFLRKADDGWCRDLATLIESNNFWIDIDQEFDIVTVDFDLDEHIIEKKTAVGTTVNSLDNDAVIFFSNTFKLNITDTVIVPYWYDINLADYSQTNYLMIKSAKTKKIYFMTYMVDGEFIETDLTEIAERERIAATLNLHIYDKYGKSKR